ncbi:hypothetical protein CR513_04966, partial [Mucuna pruriens]
MIPTLQETKSESSKCIRVVGGEYQYGMQPYPNRPAAYNIDIWTSWEHAGSESEQLSTIGSAIPGAVIPSTTITTSAISRKFFCNG